MLKSYNYISEINGWLKKCSFYICKTGLFFTFLTHFDMSQSVVKVFAYLFRLIGFNVRQFLPDSVNEFLQYLISYTSMTLFSKENVLVEEFHIELGLGSSIHALGGDFDALLQAVQDSL